MAGKPPLPRYRRYLGPYHRLVALSAALGLVLGPSAPVVHAQGKVQATPLPPSVSAPASAVPVASPRPDGRSVPGHLPDALLAAGALHDGCTDGGLVEGSDFDIDEEAFDASGGLRIVSRVWNRASEDGPLIVFDFRMAFATPEAAVA